MVYVVFMRRSLLASLTSSSNDTEVDDHCLLAQSLGFLTLLRPPLIWRTLETSEIDDISGSTPREDTCDAIL